MAQLSKLLPIALFIASMAGGIFIFYLTSHLSKETKKLHIEQMISELITFVIFIWLGKIIINITLFVQDPLAVLAYPSDSKAVYIAVLLSGISLYIKSKKGKIQAISLFESFLPVFLVSSFLYEFIQIVWLSKGGAIGYFILITILLALYYLIRERLGTYALFMIILSGWSFGIVLLTLIQPFVTVFGYMMAPWFIWVFFTVHIFIIFRKRDVNGWN